MSLDRKAADRRRFAQLTGLSDDLRSGLPVGRRDTDETTQS
ncbi:hypothetical protein [Halovivax gelatinilyticus]|nr:hypothetical protein [Halovivax gelatinilyticus]